MILGSIGLSDEAFLRSLEDFTYPIESFRHADHLRLGWILLKDKDVEAASNEAASIIQSLGQRNGKGHAYNETVTRAWMRLLATHSEGSFEEFLCKNEARLSIGLLHEFWHPETLNSHRARTEWVEPDIQALPSV